jgi:hypothetical protein
VSLLHCKHKSYGANEKWYYSNYSVVRSLAQVSPYKTPASGWLAAHAQRLRKAGDITQSQFETLAARILCRHPGAPACVCFVHLFLIVRWWR